MMEIVQSSLIAESANHLMSQELNLLMRQFTLFYSGIGILATFITILISVSYWKTIKDAKEQIDSLVKKAVAEEISNRVNQRIEDVEKIIQKEAIVSQTVAKYCLPMLNPDVQLLEEYQLLKNRGFQISPVENYERRASYAKCHVLIMDFVNANFPDDQEVVNILKEVANNIPDKSTIVIYIKRRVAELDSIFSNQDVYYTPANNILTLMGRVIDAAQIANTTK